jgi:hypothetical protein
MALSAFNSSSVSLGRADCSSLRGYLVEPGEFKVTIGGKQHGLTGTADAATTGLVEGRAS